MSRARTEERTPWRRGMLRRLGWGLGLMGVGGPVVLVFALSDWAYTLKTAQWGMGMTLGMGSALAGMLLLLRIRCPECGTRLFWYAAARQGLVGLTLDALLRRRRCPRCHTDLR